MDHYDLSSFLILFLQLISSVGAITSTGGYSVSNFGTINTPNYPSNYDANLNRIWVLQAPTLQGVELDIGPVTGEDDGSGDCYDYLEVRDGSAGSDLLFKSCLTTSNTTIRSTSRWLWVKFYSNWEVEKAGFAATWTHYSRSNVNDTEISPIRSCRGNEIRCPNKECVTSSWRCDGFNDCGYDGDGSDEDWWCFTKPMDPVAKYAYGVSIGVVVFTLLILLVGWLYGRFAGAGRCGRGPKSCLGLDRIRTGPRTRRLPSYTGPQTPAMLLLTGQHEKFEQLAAQEWEKKTDAYRRASVISLAEVAQTYDAEPEPEKPLTKPAAVQQKGQQKLQRLRSARDEVPQELIS